MWPLLKLTPEEREWSDYYDAPGSTKKGVLVRRYPGNLTLDASKRSGLITHQAARRQRVFAITWSGDVNALRVNVRTSEGESYTVGPCHIPSLSGHNVHSTLNEAPWVPPYPTPPFFAVQQQSAWILELEPNIILPGAKQLFFDYSLENPNDPALSGENPVTYTVWQVLHCWEFPGWKGDPR